METILLSVHVLLGPPLLGWFLSNKVRAQMPAPLLAAERPRRSSVQRVLEVS